MLQHIFSTICISILFMFTSELYDIIMVWCNKSKILLIDKNKPETTMWATLNMEFVINYLFVWMTHLKKYYTVSLSPSLSLPLFFLSLIHSHTHAHAYTYTYAYTSKHPNIHQITYNIIHVHTTQTLINTLTHACTFIHTHTHFQAHIHRCKHKWELIQMLQTRQNQQFLLFTNISVSSFVKK